jgi:hypothetical protein
MDTNTLRKLAAIAVGGAVVYYVLQTPKSNSVVIITPPPATNPNTGTSTGTGTGTGTGIVAAPPTTNAPVDNATYQSEWRFCEDCHLLFYQGVHYSTACVVTKGAHNGESSQDIKLAHTIKPPEQAQDQFFWCSRCTCLHYGGPGGEGVCKFGRHDRNGSGLYYMSQAKPATSKNPIAVNWCNKCYCIFQGSHEVPCAAGDHHDRTFLEVYWVRASND